MKTAEDPHEHELRAPPARRAFVVVSCAVLVLLSVLILLPFAGALLAALAFAVLLAPVRRAWSAGGRGDPAGVLAVLTAGLAVVPLALGAWTVLAESAEAYPAVRGRLGELRLGLEPVLPLLERAGAWAGGLAAAVARDAAAAILDLAVFSAALFLFLRDGPALLRRAERLVPLPAADKERLLARVREVLLAVLSGIFAVGLLQGLLAWAGLALLGIPFAALLGALCAALSPVPLLGTALVGAPVVLYALSTGAVAKAWALGLWFAFGVGLADNLARPLLLGARMKVPVPLVFIAVAGALRVFGFAGLFAGPLVLGLAAAALDISEERGG